MGPPRRIPQIGKIPHVRPGKVKKRSPRVQLEGLAKRASLRTIPDRIVLEYVLGAASLTINQPKMGQNGADYSEIWVRKGAYPRLEKCLMYGLER